MMPNHYHYMISSRNMQRPPPSLPKMEYSNDSRHGQTTPLTPSGISEDPYRFVDDEMSSPTQTIASGMDNSLSNQPNQMMPNYAIGGEDTIQGSQHNVMRTFIPNDAITSNNHAIIKEPKKRGRKKKMKDDNWWVNLLKYVFLKWNYQLIVHSSSVEHGTEAPRPIKERKKHDRFNGMSEEEVSQRFLPDHISENLDIVIVSVTFELYGKYLLKFIIDLSLVIFQIGINPGLFAAYKGHHYAGPGKWMLRF
jgi:hypothetical protein